MNRKKFIHHKSDGSPWGIVSTEQLLENVYAIKYNKPEEPLAKEVWDSLFQSAKSAAINLGAEIIGLRVRKEYEHQVVCEILSDLGFKKEAERIEYQCDVSLLPNDVGTPFQWKTAKELGWNKEQVAEFSWNVVEGALDIDPAETPEYFISDWLNHDDLTSGLDCISIGFINSSPCALTVAQVEQKTGWSRISYMGLIPSYRGKGLGKWVHRRGFEMMKAQGGKLYHGGTHGENFPMQKLFLSHGCKLYCEMEEWVFRVKGNF